MVIGAAAYRKLAEKRAKEYGLRCRLSGSKAVANESKYPLIVELAVAANGLDVEINRQIVGFHKSRGIAPRFGRSIWRNEQPYYPWCFSDLETARAFIERFGGAFYKTTGT